MHIRRTAHRTRALLYLLTAMLVLPARWAPAQARAPSAAGTPVQPVLRPPKDDRPGWAVGFAALEPLDLKPESLYLAYSIPLILREKLLSIREHRLSEDERRSHGQQLVNRKVREVSAQLVTRRRERDALAAGSTASQRELRDLQTKQEQIDLLTREVRFLEGLDPAQVEVKETKPVSFGSAAAPDSAGLLPSPRYSPLQAARVADLDLLVFGTIEQVDDVLFLTVRAIDFPRGRVLVEYQDAFGSADAYGSLAGLADALAGAILGREWGRLRVRSEPSDAQISVNGEFAGVGEAFVAFAPTGELEVSVERRGYLAVREAVSVTAGEQAEIGVVLVPAPEVMLTLTSSPLLADVYLDSRYVGRTPVELPRPAGLERVELRKEGFDGQAFHLSPQSPLDLQKVLRPSIYNPVERQKSEREGFYRAAGVWALTIPLPLFFWAVSLDQVTAFQAATLAGDAADQLELVVRYRRSYAGYLGGLFVNLSLFTNVIISLVRYVAAADRPAG